jgi:uncharacterized protein (UPF0147 family)
MVQLADIISLLDEIREDRTVPKNIRAICEEAQSLLNDQDKDMNIKIDSVRQLLDRISEDANLPIYTRTQVWNIVSVLESV